MGGVCEGSGVVSSVLQNVDLNNIDSSQVVQSLISAGYSLIAAKLPFDWGTSPEEESTQNSQVSQFVHYLAQPTEKPIYEEELQTLDAMGAIDLSRITRENWPNKETNYLLLLSFNTYEKESYALGAHIVTDAIDLAKIYKSHGYRVAYLFNSTAKEFYKWTDFFIENVKREVTVYFAGIGTNIVESSTKLTQILAFRNEHKDVSGVGTGITEIEAVPGLGANSVSEDYLLDIVDRAAKSTLRTVFLTNVVNNSSVFTANANYPLLTAASRGNAKHRVPPYRTIYIQNNSSTATNQHSFVVSFLQLTSNKNTTFTQLKGEFTNQTYAVAPDGGVTINAHTDALYAELVIWSIDLTDVEIQVEQITSDILGVDPSQVTSLPDPTVLAQAEIEAMEQRWSLFTAEMKKTVAYDTKYKTSLQQLDSLGCINLERLNRLQIPNIRIDRVAALFFCPYEDLSHTLNEGPVNDGLMMAKLYLAMGYKIVYLMDATPKEFYSWMDWLLTNIRGEILVYFSGHGTQIRDYSGKEADGLSELLVFYNDSLKSTKLPKITAQSGITDMTISDDVLHNLIILKDYPDTRIVLISDCCHSGTMYNFDQTVVTSPVRPPLNVVAIGAAKDEQTAKQTVLGGKESGVFTYSLDTVLRQNKSATFVDLETYTKKNIAKYQQINITTTNKDLVSQKIIMPPIYSSDPTARNYSPALITESDLAKRVKSALTSIPADGQKIRAAISTALKK